MANYNEGGNNELSDEKEVGENCKLFLPGNGDTPDNSTPVSNVSFSEEANTSEVQYTDSFTQSIAVTGVTYSGSFTIPGNADNERGLTWSNGSGESPTLPSYVPNITIRDQNKDFTFGSVLINSHSKDIPADDRTEHSFDFMAETLTVETV
jgi:hypothetical protein